MPKNRNPAGEAGLDTARGCNDRPNVAHAPDIIKQIDATLSRINRKLVGTFCRDSKTAVILLSREVML